MKDAIIGLVIVVAVCAGLVWLVGQAEDAGCQELCAAVHSDMATWNSYGCMCTNETFFPRPASHYSTTTIHTSGGAR